MLIEQRISIVVIIVLLQYSYIKANTQVCGDFLTSEVYHFTTQTPNQSEKHGVKAVNIA